MNTRQLLAAVKRRHGITSDYGLAKHLGVAKQQVSAYMDGTTLGDDVAMRVADALELDRAAVLAAMALERAKSDDARRAWRDALKRLGGLAAGVLILLTGTPPPPAAGAVASVAAAHQTGCVLCKINRRRKAKWFNALRRLLAGLTLTTLAAACAHPGERPPHKVSHVQDCASYTRLSAHVEQHGAPLNVGTAQALAQLRRDAAAEGCAL